MYLQIPATIRLQRAMEVHAALQERSANSSCSSAASSHNPTPSVKEGDIIDSNGPTTLLSASVDDLAAQLKTLWQLEKDQKDQSDHESESHSSTSLTAALQKIGSREKDELLIHLLEQQDALRTQRSEAADLGEKIAAKLLHQQVNSRHNACCVESHLILRFASTNSVTSTESTSVSSRLSFMKPCTSIHKCRRFKPKSKNWRSATASKNRNFDSRCVAGPKLRCLLTKSTNLRMIRCGAGPEATAQPETREGTQNDERPIVGLTSRPYSVQRTQML